MNWQTEKFIEDAILSVCDDGVFSPDQIKKLTSAIQSIARAIDKESDCNKPSINM